MSAGHHLRGDEPAPLSVVRRYLQGNPGLREAVARAKHPIVSRQFRVPYLAGASIDGRMVYIDSQTLERFPRSGIEPDEAYPYHEYPEWYLMTRLGLPYFPARGWGAHRIAHGIEWLCLSTEDGYSDDQIREYEAESAALVNIDEHLKLPPEAFPPDLYLGPYQARGDSDKTEAKLDARLLPLLRTAQTVYRRAA